MPTDVHLGSAPDDLNLTVCPASGRELAPVVLVLPGGGYQFHADHEAEPVAQWLSSLGMHGVVLRYRLGDDPLESAERDARAAVSWLRGDATAGWAERGRLAVLGFSAGGHVAGLLATGTEPPDAAVLCYPLTSFLDEPERTEALLALGLDAGRRERLTLARRVGPGTCPMFVWHTADDAVVPVSHSLDLTRAATAAGVRVELHVPERGGHGLGLAERQPAGAWRDLCQAWFTAQGWLEGTHAR